MVTWLRATRSPRVRDCFGWEYKRRPDAAVRPSLKRGVYMDVLDYQWDVAAKFWTEIDGLARANDARVAIEMHPHNLVFSPDTLKKLVDLVGATDLGAEIDPSHLMWQGMDVVACIKWLGPLVFHAAAEDAAITPGVDIRGVLDTSFERVPARRRGQGPHRLRLLVQRLATEPGVAIRGRRHRARRRLLDGVPAGRWPRSTRTWRSTSSTKTRTTAASKGSPSPPRTSWRPPPRYEVTPGPAELRLGLTLASDD